MLHLFQPKMVVTLKLTPSSGQVQQISTLLNILTEITTPRRHTRLLSLSNKILFAPKPWEQNNTIKAGRG